MRIHAKEGNMKTGTAAARLAGEQGISLVETMIATLITIVGLSSVLSLFAVGMLHSQTQAMVVPTSLCMCRQRNDDRL